jgi:hypothetical protein
MIMLGQAAARGNRALEVVRCVSQITLLSGI